MSSPALTDVEILGLVEAIRHVPAAVGVCDAAGRVVYTNARARALTEQLGEPMPEDLDGGFDTFHLDGRQYERDEWPVVRSITDGEEVVDEEYFHVLPDGGRLVLRCSSSPVHDDAGRTVAGVVVMVDITADRRTAERLSYFDGLLEHTDDAIVGTDADFRLTFWNPGAERLYGYTAAEVLGRHAREVGSYDGDRSRRQLEGSLLDTGRTRTQLTAYRKDGSQVEVEMVAVAVCDDRGEVVGHLGVHRDITERKRAEDGRRVAEQRVVTVLESITDAFVAVDADWRFTYVNDRALQWMQAELGRAGLEREDVLGQGMWEVVSDAVGSEIYERCHDAMRERRPLEFETYFAPSGQWSETHAYPADGGLSIYFRDITDRKRAEEQRQESLRQTETILESITDSFFALDHAFRFSYLNRRAVDSLAQILGAPLRRDDFLGRRVWDMFPGILGTEAETIIRRTAAERTPLVIDYLYPTTKSWFEVNTYPYERGVAVYFRAIDDRKNAERERDARAHQQAVIATLGVQALSEVDPQAVMDEAVVALARTLQVEITGVAEIVPGRDVLLLRAGAGWKPGAVGRATGPAGGDSLVGYTAMTGGPVVSEDLESDGRFRLAPVLAEQGPASGATVVIAGRDAPFGVLGAFAKHRRLFSSDDINFMQAVANVISVAFETASTEARLREVREAERRRIARDLHDEALQGLTEALGKASRRAAPASSESHAELAGALKRVGQQLRGAIYDLRLEEEENRPLHERLKALVEVQAAMTDARITLRVSDTTPALSGYRGTEVVRIVGEALTNARRHSGATDIRVEASGSEDLLRVEVVDNGAGFDPEAVPSVAQSAGLSGIRERADLLSARLEIEAGGERGTVVRFELALVNDEPAVVRVLLIEDHVAVREAIAAMLDREPDLTVVGQAGSLAEARGMLGGVDVALIDLGLPDGFGADLIEEVRKVNPRAESLILSASFDRANTARCVQKGAAGMIDKTAGLDEVIEAVRRLRAGEALLPLEEVVELLGYDRRRRAEEHADRQAIEALTPREHEVLRALANGLDSQAIADRLHITLRTERNHIANILAKLGVHSRLQALVFCLRYGVLEIPARTQRSGDPKESPPRHC
jgi:PAS domain S-box-containing protein